MRFKTTGDFIRPKFRSPFPEISGDESGKAFKNLPEERRQPREVYLIYFEHF